MQQLQTHVEQELELEQPRVLTAEEILAVAGGPYVETDI